jgi:hypothetical protein
MTTPPCKKIKRRVTAALEPHVPSELELLLARIRDNRAATQHPLQYTLSIKKLEVGEELGNEGVTN